MINCIDAVLERSDWSKVLWEDRKGCKLCFCTTELNEKNLHLFLNYSSKFPLSIWDSFISSLQHTPSALSPPLLYKQHATFVWTFLLTCESDAGLVGSDSLSQESLCRVTWGENTYSGLTPSIFLEDCNLKSYRVWLLHTK